VRAGLCEHDLELVADRLTRQLQTVGNFIDTLTLYQQTCQPLGIERIRRRNASFFIARKSRIGRCWGFRFSARLFGIKEARP
jgi:hypothetical protein